MYNKIKNLTQKKKSAAVYSAIVCRLVFYLILLEIPTVSRYCSQNDCINGKDYYYYHLFFIEWEIEAYPNNLSQIESRAF